MLKRLSLGHAPHPLLWASALVLGITSARGASADYMITVDTSSIEGQQGFIDIEFNPGLVTPVLAATATITDFTTDAMFLTSLNATPAGVDGDASGTLPGTLTINNTDALNEVFQPVTYGTAIIFDVALSGAAVSVPDPLNYPGGSSFGLTLYASDFATPLLTNDPNGTVDTVNLNADGTTTLLSFFQPQTASVPEPTTFALVGIGLVGFIGGRWRRKAVAA